MPNRRELATTCDGAPVGCQPKTPADPLSIDKLHWLLRRSVVGYFIGHDIYGLLTGPGSVEGSMASWPGLPHGH
jgi:hypothetical protein